MSTQNYIDLNAIFRFMETHDVVISVNNVFDKEPPLVGGSLSTNANTIAGYYDTLGRYLQDEISAAIVAKLKETLGLNVEVTPRAIATTNTQAHEAYLRGRYLVNQRTQISIENAIVEFEKAIMIDPDYAVAQAELAARLFWARM